MMMMMMMMMVVVKPDITVSGWTDRMSIEAPAYHMDFCCHVGFGKINQITSKIWF